MNVQISDKKKKEMFVSVFQVLKNCSSLICANFETNRLHIQGMDKSHICLFDIKLADTWFTKYAVPHNARICFDSNVFHSIISTKGENQDVIITMEDVNQETLHINFESQETKKGDFKKSFLMPLADYDYEEMHIPEVDYDAEFSLSSKQISEMFSQLSNFGSDIIIKCSEQDINLTTNGSSGEMRVDIPIDDLNSYSVVEDAEIKLTYSLAYMNKMCITSKLSNDIDFSLSNDRPMKIEYSLGDESSMVFFIAPKVED